MMLPVVVEMHFSPGFTKQTGHATVHAFCGRLRTLRSVSLLALAIVLSLGRVHGAVEQDDRTVAADVRVLPDVEASDAGVMRGVVVERVRHAEHGPLHRLDGLVPVR